MANEGKAPTLTTSVQIGKGIAFTGDLFTADSMTALGMVQGRIRIAHGDTFNDLRLEDQTGPQVLDRINMGSDLSAVVPVVMPLDASLLTKINPSGTRAFGYSQPQKPVETSFAVIPLIELGGGLRFTQGAWTRLAGNGVTGSTAASAVVSAAGAAGGATSVPVAALTRAIPNGTKLIFLPGANKSAKLTAAAIVGATTLTVEAIPTALVSGDSAPISDPLAIPAHALWIWRASLGFGDLGFGVEDGGREIVEVTAQALYSLNAAVPDGAKLGMIGNPVFPSSPGIDPTSFFFGSPT
jgi:hypothetical protein